METGIGRMRPGNSELFKSGATEGRILADAILANSILSYGAYFPPLRTARLNVKCSTVKVHKGRDETVFFQGNTLRLWILPKFT